MTNVHVEPAAPIPIVELESNGTEAASTVSAQMEHVAQFDAISGIDGIASPERLRDAAVSLDEAHRGLGEVDTERALLLWEGLLRGRVKLVDWFDSDGRRFVLVKLNNVEQRCGCGLTAREYQVAMSAALGESSKVTGYRLEISPSRVSALLKSSMRKLGVKTKAQLVMMVRVLGRESQEPLTTSRNV